ncbi:MAG TPA: response regulator [Candidatus Udaeobacter sp.]|jgi:CheY-like chemotaxis protein|nr:response regulator [Candidatus Udaeobacter sp.]
MNKTKTHKAGLNCVETQLDLKEAEILVVDDHEEFLHFMMQILTMLGWSVISSSTAQDALDKLSYIRPSLILLDMRMPEMDGFELTRILKNDPAYRDILIFAVTGLDTPANRKLCLEAGCDDFISKPFRVPDLHNRMMRLLSKDELWRSR